MDSQAWGEQEFLGAAVNDQRQARSLARMGARLLEHPAIARILRVIFSLSPSGAALFANYFFR